jgi:signal transduction histidine kinase
VLAVRRYAIAVLLTSLALGLAILGEETWGIAAPFSFFLVAVMISSWVGGLGPGLLATFLGIAAADYFTIPPLQAVSFDVGRAAQLGTFIGIALLISSLNDSRRLALAAVNEERAQLEARVAQRTAELAGANADLRAAHWEQQQLLHDLGERVKELTAVNVIGTRLLDDRGDPADLLARVVVDIPKAWQYPEITEARISAGSIEARTQHFEPTPWMQRAEFLVAGDAPGAIEVAYREARPDASEGPFLLEERNLIDLLAGMLQAYFERRHAEAEAEAGRREAQSANAAKDDFLATLSHELRTPLNVMLGWTRMLRSGQMSGEAAAKGLEVLERSVHLQTKLIEDLLDISRIITGRLALEKSRVDLVAIAAVAIDSARPAALGQAVHLTASLPPALWIEADPQRIQQVISNLLNNALKFTPAHGSIHVRVEQAGDAATIEVQDTGVGIARDVLPRIFNRFEQGDQSTTRRFGGLGIGLAIVKYFVEQHDGLITASSQGPNHGSCFTITLPLRVGVSPGSVPPAHSSTQSA